MNSTTIHVGLDVHKKTTAVAVSQGPGRARFIGTIDSNPRALLKVLGKLGDAQEMSVVYEAGPCGYDLYRRLRCGGYRCEVIAPLLNTVWWICLGSRCTGWPWSMRT